MGKKPKPIEVKPEWFDEALEAIAKAREDMVWQPWEDEKIQGYKDRVSERDLCERLNELRAERDLPPRPLGSVRAAIAKAKGRAK